MVVDFKVVRESCDYFFDISGAELVPRLQGTVAGLLLSNVYSLDTFHGCTSILSHKVDI